MSSLKEDLEELHTDFGISPLLIEDLQKSPETARGVIKFFKRSMYVANSVPMVLGIIFITIGLEKLLVGLNMLGLILLPLGAVLFLLFFRTLLIQIKAHNRMLYVARKHNLTDQL